MTQPSSAEVERAVTRLRAWEGGVPLGKAWLPSEKRYYEALALLLDAREALAEAQSEAATLLDQEFSATYDPGNDVAGRLDAALVRWSEGLDAL